VFELIRQVQPTDLYIAADGPRAAKPGDAALCSEVRRIVGNVDWACNVRTLFREENLGCRNAVSSAITWFFQQVEEGIIIEDDVVPDPTFFSFCSQMLERFRTDQRVMMISGLNVAEEWKSGLQSYHFSYYGGIWGWASWRRAWRSYDPGIRLWNNPEIRRLLLGFFPVQVKASREKLYDDLYNGKIDTWDFQWTFAKLLNSGLNVIPSRNMIRNIGDNGGVHATYGRHPWTNLRVEPMKFPVVHNAVVMSDTDYDAIHLGIKEHKTSIGERLKENIYGLVSKFGK
jgi:hypothetical protein